MYLRFKGNLESLCHSAPTLGEYNFSITLKYNAIDNYRFQFQLFVLPLGLNIDSEYPTVLAVYVNTKWF